MSSPTPTESEAAKVSRPRSPNHPALNLESAIEKAGVLHGKYRRGAAGFDDAVKTLGYTPGGSSGNQAIAALKAYGLVDVDGSGAKRKVAVSEGGERIIRNAPDRASLVQAAALSPPIHKELWDKYRGEGGLPHDDILRRYLVWERPEGSRFIEDSVDGFIERLRDTLAYAGITAADKLDGGKGSRGDEEGDQEEDDRGGYGGLFAEPDPFAARGKPAGKKGGGMLDQMPEVHQETFLLPEGTGAVRFPTPQSADSVLDLEDHFNLILKKLRRRFPELQQQHKPSTG